VVHRVLSIAFTKALETAETKAKAEIFTLRAQTYFSKNEFDQVIRIAARE